MAITNDTIKVTLSGDGVTQEFSFPFKIYATSDISVWLIDKTTGDITVRSLTTHYLVDIDLIDEGGTVIFDEDHIPTSDEWVFMFSNLAFVQNTHFQNDGIIREETISNGMDRIVRLIQQLRDRVRRSPALPIESSLIDLELPEPESLKVIRWNEDADELENRDPIPEVELRKEGDWLQWKLTEDDTWQNLVALADITGPQGEVEEAPTDSKVYGRKDEGWEELPEINDSGTAATDLWSADKIGTELADIKDHLSQDIQELTDGATINWDMNSGGYANVTIAGNRTLANPTNVVAGGTYKLRIIQDATGSREITWGANYTFPGAVEPTLSSGANDEDEFTFYAHSTSKLVCQNAVFDV